MPVVTSNRPCLAHSWAWRHRLGFTVSGHSASRYEYTSRSHTTRPSASVMMHGSRDSTRPRSEFSKSDRSSCDGPLLEGPLLEGPLLEGPLLEGPLLEGPLLEGPLLEGPLLEGPLSGISAPLMHLVVSGREIELGGCGSSELPAAIEVGLPAGRATDVAEPERAGQRPLPAGLPGGRFRRPERHSITTE